ncbi:endo-1,4-beta-xylanase [Verrucomicrobiota bacterium]
MMRRIYLIITMLALMSVEVFASTGGATLTDGWQYVAARGEYSSLRQALPVVLESRTTGDRGGYPRSQLQLDDAFNADDVYMLSLRARAINSDVDTPTALTVELRSKTSTGRFTAQFKCGPVLNEQWETFSAPFALSRDFSAGELYIFLAHGWGEADIEVQDVRIENRGSAQPLTAYSRVGRWYHGQEADAAWRSKAQAMIEKNRMGDFSIEVVDAEGAPVKGAKVVIQQQRHAYRFGVAVKTTLMRWIAPGADSNPALQAEFENYRLESGRTDLTFKERQAEIQRYFEVLKSDFNFAVLENALKWRAWSGDWGGFSKQETLRMIDWLKAQGLGVKGHVLVWPGWKNSPGFVKELADEPEALNRLVNAHITDMGAALNGRVVSMDVLNETFNNHDYMDLLGNDVMAEWFKQAREVMPNAQLNLNDFQLMANGGRWTEKLDFYDALVGSLLEADAPLDAVGFQSHFRHTFLTGPERIWALCDRFSRYRLPLVCSEFDLNEADEELQAAYTRDFLTAWFAHPGTNAFIQWGFWQGSHWLPYAGLYDRDWRMKPNARAYRDLVYNQWWTGWEETETQVDGHTVIRGFLGDYRVTVYASGDETVLENVTLKKEGTKLTIRL